VPKNEMSLRAAVPIKQNVPSKDAARAKKSTDV